MTNESATPSAHFDFAQGLNSLILTASRAGLPAQAIAQTLIYTGQLIESNSASRSTDPDPDLEEYDPRLGVAELPFTPEELAKNTPNYDPSDLII